MEKPTGKVEEFIEAYGKLVEEFKVDFANYPMFVPDGQGGFRVVVQTVPVDKATMKNGGEEKMTVQDFIAR